MQFGLMNGVAGTYARAGVLVNAISPVAATRMMTRRVGPGALRPEDVAPGVAYLASAECQTSGVVRRAANGRFSIGRYAVSAGVDLGSKGSIEIEAVADAWRDITGDQLEAP
jgi:NAD(P)-dependent dehydrogenase (short-subunit alcohol dehydrogenase family)